MKVPLPVAAALTGAAQAQIETGASRHGMPWAADLAIPVEPSLTAATPPGAGALPWLCFRTALATPLHHLRGGDAVGSLN